MKYLIYATIILLLTRVDAQAYTSIVTNTNDSGIGSFRYTVTNYADTIRFDPALIANGSATINLGSGIIKESSQSITIIGLYNATDTLYITGSSSYPILDIKLTNINGFNATLVLDSMCFRNSIQALRVQRAQKVEVKNCVFRNNHGLNTSQGNFDGAAIDIGSMGISTPSSVTFIVTNSSFSNNTASSGGAIHMSSLAALRYFTIDRCTFNGNSASSSGKGGAILLKGAFNPSSETYVTIERSTFTNNSAPYGGAFVLEDANSSKFRTYIRYSTIVGNTTTNSSGQAVEIAHQQNNSSHSCRLENSIMALNTGSGSNKDFAFTYSLPSYGVDNASGSFNIFSNQFPAGLYASNDNFIGTTATVNLGPLQNNGGTTKTRVPNVGSIAIDAGDPSVLIDAQNSSISGVRDIGAAEYSLCLTDAVAPVADVVSLAVVTAECELNSLTAPTATDDCASSVVGTHNASFPITASTTITWTYDDGNGNTSTQTQNVVINDNTAPVADVGSLSDVMAQCEVTSLTAPTATDNCAGAITGTHNASFPIASSTTITWTYDDGNGNTSTQTQEVVINDNTAPVADAGSLVDVTAQCEVTSLTAPTATDNCAGAVTGTHNASLPISSSVVVTWTFDDGNGNTSTQSQNVVINDVTAPVPTVANLSSIADECEITSLAAPTANDNCAGSITGTHNATFPITASTTVTWTYDDGNGNTVTQTQDVVITPIDNSITQLDPITLSADASGYSYQWVDCNNGNAPILGATAQTFIAAANGNYAVEIDNGSCSVTSSCVQVLTVGIENEELDDLSIYPNPTNSITTIRSELSDLIHIELLDATGRLVYSKPLYGVNTYDVQLPDVSGFYFIRVNTSTSQRSFKLLKN